MAEQASPDLSPEALAELRWAYQHLEHPSLAARLSDLLASPVESGLKVLPVRWQKRVRSGAELAILRALDVALTSLDGRSAGPSQDWAHRGLAVAAGAVGGFFGPLTVLAELPVTTLLILRSIADVARSQGEDLAGMEAKIACVQVFGLGGRSGEDDAAELGYYGLRISLGLHFERILEFTGPNHSVHIPAVINLARAIAARFGVVISDKAAVQMIPIAGAASGAVLNYLFMQHYQDVARGHFIVRRLEREHGFERIREAYLRVEEEERQAEREFSPIEGF